MTKEEIVETVWAAFKGSSIASSKSWIKCVFLPALELEGLVVVDKEGYEKMCANRDMHQKMGDDWWAAYQKHKRNCHHDDDANQ